MPELAEVEYYRRQWDAGLGFQIFEARLHPGSRVFLGTDVFHLKAALAGSVLESSEAHGKRMLFRFVGCHWLGVHLGMTGRLSVESASFAPGRHDHLVLVQSRRCLVFSDPRQFGRVLFHTGDIAPEWWLDLPAEVQSRAFTLPAMGRFLRRHGRVAIKAALLLQEGFPGVGNWMADEILWRARVDPRVRVQHLTAPQGQRVWRQVRWVCRHALRTVGQNGSDPPRGWLFHQRWNRQGQCPHHRLPLRRGAVGGRTTVWCSLCQKR